jgi:hypothetical protein
MPLRWNPYLFILIKSLIPPGYYTLLLWSPLWLNDWSLLGTIHHYIISPVSITDPPGYRAHYCTPPSLVTILPWLYSSGNDTDPQVRYTTNPPCYISTSPLLHYNPTLVHPPLVWPMSPLWLHFFHPLSGSHKQLPSPLHYSGTLSINVWFIGESTWKYL